MTDERTIWLAALLHDIGKFWENAPPLNVPTDLRAAEKYGHEAYSAWFVRQYASPWTEDLQAAEQMVVKHHQPSLPDELLIQIADWLASYERVQAQEGETGGKGKRETVLRSILTRVRGAQTARYHPLASLKIDRETLFPRDEANVPTPDYAQVWEDFISDLQKINYPHPRTLQALLFKHFWAAPSDRQYEDIPDVSLYHHMTSTAAIALCLARAKLNEDALQTLASALKELFLAANAKPPRQPVLTDRQMQMLQTPIALLVKGDISGTQNFLYLLTSRGAARGLRGRSFYLQLLTETVADWMLRQLNLPLTNRLYVGGGHFYLLVPYANCSDLDELRTQIAQKLWQAHEGDLSLNIGYVPVAPIDFVSENMYGRGFAKKWEEVADAVNARKLQRWVDLGSEQMAQHLFTPRDEGATAEEICQVCHGEWKAGEDRTDEGVRKCRRCASFEDLGKELRDPAYLVHFLVNEKPLPERPRWSEVLQAFGTEVHIVNRREDGGLQLPTPPEGATGAVLEQVDDTDFLCEEALQLADQLRVPTAFDFRLLADATPYDERRGQVADYDHLAEQSQGVKWLGVLRMDVDSLGDLFRRGFKRTIKEDGKPEERDDATLSRMATLSGSLRLFFEAYVPLLCRAINTDGRDGKVYLLYAGGDDLFVVGSWSVLPELAQRIRDEFRAFVGGDHVTISAGIAIEHDKYPLYRLADDAKHALDDRAKELRRQVNGNGREKDAVCLLGEAMGWEQFQQVTRWKDELLAMLHASNGREKVSRALLTRLMEISQLYRANANLQRARLRKGEVTEQQYRSLVDHDRWRWRMVYHLSRFAQRYRSQEQALQNLKDALSQKGLIQNIHIAARWAELLTREGG